MPTYSQMISRSSYAAGGDPLVPDPVSAAVIQALPTDCVLLQRAKSVTLSSNTQRMPVLDVLPTAYWVGAGNDTGLKQTTRQMWKGIELVVEELATIVPIPEAYLADSQVPIWSEVQPRLTEAIGQMIDSAGLFGVNKPTTWPSDIYSAAVAAGNVVTAGTGMDLGVDVASVGELLSDDGFTVDGFASRPGLSWKLTGMRTVQGVPIYQPDLQEGNPEVGSLYGYPLNEVKNGSWLVNEAQLIAGAWDYAMLGIRQDISFKMFDQGVISDDTGAVVLNLMQQDAVAMRVTMRVAFATASPATRLNPDATSRYPFAVLQTQGASS